MIRDHDNNETEVRAMRLTLEALDTAMRRFATGDIRTALSLLFPVSFEGLRRDFNRGTDIVARSLDAIAASVRMMRMETNGLREVIATGVVESAGLGHKTGRVVDEARTVQRIAEQHGAMARHCAVITHNARHDMKRVVATAERACTAIDTAFGQEDNPAPPDMIATVRERALEVVRELAGMEVYLEALNDHLQQLSAQAEDGAQASQVLLSNVEDIARTQAQAYSIFSMSTTALDQIDRNLTDVSRETGRYSGNSGLPPVMPPPGHNGPFLRLVKK